MKKLLLNRTKKILSLISNCTNSQLNDGRYSEVIDYLIDQVKINIEYSI